MLWQNLVNVETILIDLVKKIFKIGAHSAQGQIGHVCVQKNPMAVTRERMGPGKYLPEIRTEDVRFICIGHALNVHIDVTLLDIVGATV
jgi:hypothetical protein